MFHISEIEMCISLTQLHKYDLDKNAPSHKVSDTPGKAAFNSKIDSDVQIDIGISICKNSMVQ